MWFVTLKFWRPHVTQWKTETSWNFHKCHWPQAFLCLQLYHGYEICGLEHLPKDGPALIIYYHGAIPIDMYYFVARVQLKLDRLIYTVGDRFLFKLPGWKIIAQALKVSPGTVKSCTETLNRGNLLAISPGGVYEAQFGNSNYELLWQNRMGFAKVAIESKAPIIPMFTENLREGFRNIGIARRFFIKLWVPKLLMKSKHSKIQADKLLFWLILKF